MRTIRDQLDTCIEKAGWGTNTNRPELIDALMKDFEITPKPAIEDEVLGLLIGETYTQGTKAFRGNKLRHLLAGRGLEIVRIDDDR
jgi:hypothetical protein